MNNIINQLSTFCNMVNDCAGCLFEDAPCGDGQGFNTNPLPDEIVTEMNKQLMTWCKDCPYITRPNPFSDVWFCLKLDGKRTRPDTLCINRWKQEYEEV